MKKIFLLFTLLIILSISFVFAQNSPATSVQTEDVTEGNYTNMTHDERMDMLSELEIRYTDQGMLPAANYIRGQMKMLEN